MRDGQAASRSGSGLGRAAEGGVEVRVRGGVPGGVEVEGGAGVESGVRGGVGRVCGGRGAATAARAASEVVVRDIISP